METLYLSNKYDYFKINLPWKESLSKRKARFLFSPKVGRMKVFSQDIINAIIKVKNEK